MRFGSAEYGLSEVSPIEGGPNKVGPNEFGHTEHGPIEVGPTEVGPFQAGLLEVSIIQVGFSKFYRCHAIPIKTFDTSDYPLGSPWYIRGDVAPWPLAEVCREAL